MADPLQVKDEEQTATDPVVLTPDEIATQAVPADEQGAKTVEDLPTTDSGVPRITVAPVTPEPKAGVDKTKTRVFPQGRPPFIRDIQTKELKPLVEEELQRRQKQTEPLTYNKAIEKLKAGENVVLGDFTYYPQHLPVVGPDSKSANSRIKFKGRIAQFGKPIQEQCQ